MLHVELIFMARPECEETHSHNETFLHTSPILTGVATGLGMHGRGQRSRHSGCETTLHSRHFSEILPNLILFPHGTQDSGLITYDEMPVISRSARVNSRRFLHKQHKTHSFGDKLMKPDAALALWGAGLSLHVRLGVAGMLEELLRLDGLRIKFYSSCRNRRK